MAISGNRFNKQREQSYENKLHLDQLRCPDLESYGRLLSHYSPTMALV
ncbi:hypothetical protein CWATWH0005_3788 [Crocosphaera watsonii WH 0005]|uniref:Uncharacterized protein n=1 Tax=Crocosphaera watsonii WH 0005 TaxID=423472 RepID=T2J0Q3_CROWT|nr:hypothetical protein CWATWH0005_3788 [Crocosphaera watsonii WH 0005]